ncbi:DNA-binding domain-containing protein [Lacimicrobium alkaliphilum]|uniref:Uncharacterized protein n=1 Tax=Lacimicrobium alkaliphilum TaxID=1526571 RepID=A0A0U2RKP9_9ALTE|nr:putative DNA-binding domain-containing protein [Lacimicrobium alkaliphilum]ALS97850.1 hypothetical protein AT746_05905 [Lacimicrobium alkaliphilum]
MHKFHQLQQQFAQHLKNPGFCPAPSDIESRRLSIYRDLFFNNILGFLGNGFPVLQSLYDEKVWRQLCRQFYHQHHCRSPYFVDISKEFVEFLANEYQPLPSDPSFLAELAHYEWVELAISINKDIPSGEYWDGEQDYSSIQMSELAWLLSYQFPVHKICPEFQPQQASGPYFFVVCRDKDDEVCFTGIDQVNAFMLNHIEQQGPIELDSLFSAMEQAMPQFPSDQLQEQAKKALDAFMQKQVLLLPQN